MATSNLPLAPDPVTEIDGPELIPPIDPPQEDLSAPVPVGEEGNVEPDPDTSGPTEAIY